MGLNWFYSRTVRHADRMRKHVHKILSAQRDLLSPQAIQAVEASLADVRKVLQKNSPTKDVENQMAELEKTANKWLKPYPYGGLRENIEVFLVAIAVAMAVRTFFLQPFKIPTGSMQPTLFGITSKPDFSREGGLYDELRPSPEDDFEMPNFLSRFVQFWINGVQYKQVIAEADGAITDIEEPRRFLMFNLRQRIYTEAGGNRVAYTIWFPPDNLKKRAGLVDGYGTYHPKVFKKGDLIFKIKVVSGDHLFVDRLT